MALKVQLQVNGKSIDLDAGEIALSISDGTDAIGIDLDTKKETVQFSRLKPDNLRRQLKLTDRFDDLQELTEFLGLEDPEDDDLEEEDFEDEDEDEDEDDDDDEDDEEEGKD